MNNYFKVKSEFCPQCGEHMHTDQCNDIRRKTYKQLAKESIDVQNACNLSGVVHSFSRVMTDLRTLFPNCNTDWYNTHPIAVLFTCKIMQLTGIDPLGGPSEQFGKAYGWALECTL